METVRGIVDHDTIRLVTPLSLPQGAEIEFEPRIVQDKPKAPPLKLYELLDQRFHSGRSDLAERHNEHQP
jgi:hypothetical protein